MNFMNKREIEGVAGAARNPENPTVVAGLFTYFL
jgi:hypothetical protein